MILRICYKIRNYITMNVKYLFLCAMRKAVVVSIHFLVLQLNREKLVLNIAEQNCCKESSAVKNCVIIASISVKRTDVRSKLCAKVNSPATTVNNITECIRLFVFYAK